MKKTISVLLAILLVMSIAMIPVFAQDGGTQPSATGDEWELIISRGSSTHAAIQAHLDAAAATPCDIVKDGYEQVDLFDASRLKKGSNPEVYNEDAFTFTVDESLDGKDWYVVHFEKDEAWVEMTNCSYSGGKLTIPAPSLSVFAVYAKASSTSGGGSPATGDNSAYFVLMAVVFAALAVVFVKKAVKNN
ncbi:MAG: hypothetical protein IKD81_02800 [Eubacteriaceae bacterium]|nr:hypothetical protein [Eubacteriaceae bacterium]